MAKRGGILGGTVWPLDPWSHRKTGGCVSAAELPDMGAGKPAAGCEPRSGLSAQGCIHRKPRHGQATSLLTGAQQAAEPQRDFPLAPLGGAARVRTPQAAGFGDLKQSHMPETETLGHRLGEHRVQRPERERRGD